MDISARLLGFTLHGSAWVLWLLIALSVISLAVMLERFWFLAVHEPDPRALEGDMRKLLRGRGDTPSAETLAGAMAGAKARERLRLERNLAFLGTLGSNAPFIGLFGTVLGIIKAFQDLAGNSGGGPSAVMAGISEALVATAVGLMVAIPAVVSFNYFNRRVRAIMTQVDWMAHLALAAIKGEDGKDAASGAAGSEAALATAADSLPLLRRPLPVAAVAVGLLVIAGVIALSRRPSPDPVPAITPARVQPPASLPATPPPPPVAPAAKVPEVAPAPAPAGAPPPVPQPPAAAVAAPGEESPKASAPKKDPIQESVKESVKDSAKESPKAGADSVPARPAAPAAKPDKAAKGKKRRVERPAPSEPAEAPRTAAPAEGQ